MSNLYTLFNATTNVSIDESLTSHEVEKKTKEIL